MSPATEVIETKIKAFITTFKDMQPESSDLSKLYWSEVNTDTVYTALISSAAATHSTKLTKHVVSNALTGAEQVDKSFTNQALTQSDYLQNVQGIIYGNDEYATAGGISTAIEAFGERSVTFCTSSLQLFKDAKDILDLYFDTEISAAVGAVTGEELPWYEFSKSDFTEAVTMIEAFKKLINNEVATQGDYGATIAKWRKII
jgi:hypothetical protein